MARERYTWLSVHTSRSTVAEYMRVEWHTVGGICQRVYKDLKANSPSRFESLVNIDIDETSYKKAIST
ncbi:MAG: hypothetical protein K2O18_18625 [Oscillospiraceae bacterium]|nr:hypothetical protein [Oscillospiraceae bacterium]